MPPHVVRPVPSARRRPARSRPAGRARARRWRLGVSMLRP